MSFDPDRWIAQLQTCQHLAEVDMKLLCDRVRSILMEESNIQPVSSPVTICGDIHGQFWDLLELLRKGGEVPGTSYVFMARLCSFLTADKLLRHASRLGRLRGPWSLQSGDRISPFGAES